MMKFEEMLNDLNTYNAIWRHTWNEYDNTKKMLQ